MTIERHHIDSNILEDAFAINGVSVFDAFPAYYSLFEMAFFDILPSFVYSTARDQERAEILVEAAHILYMSLKMHAISMNFDHEDANHELELAILYGDCLPGRYAQMLIGAGEMNILREWLDAELLYFEKMTDMALQQNSLEDRLFDLSRAVFAMLVYTKKDEALSLGALPGAPEEFIDKLTVAFMHGNWDELLKSIEAGDTLMKQVGMIESWRSLSIDPAGLALRQQYLG